MPMRLLFADGSELRGSPLSLRSNLAQPGKAAFLHERCDDDAPHRRPVDTVRSAAVPRDERRSYPGSKKADDAG